MTDPMQALQALFGVAGQVPLFSPTSRYYTIPTATITLADGTIVTYVTRRFIPQASRYSIAQTYVVMQGDRDDTIAAQTIGDPEQFWQLCDANNAMRPDELTATIGRVLVVPLPLGVPGASNA
jgi:hypothetical protein